jgi:pyruvate formate lyase activating enzyme
MRIGGVIPLSLVDYPKRPALTIFTSGCNLRCPFCHNASLVLHPSRVEPIQLQDFFVFLKKRQGILDGVAITGGEPLLQKELDGFLKEIRDLGFAIKLDTNGCYPEALKRVVTAGLVDYVAMDIKNAPEKYPMTVGVPSFDIAPVAESIAFLMEGNVNFEFRTTVVKGIHTPADFEAIGTWIAGNEKYFLQKFVNSGDILGKGVGSFTEEEMEACLARVKPVVPNAALRY